MKLLTILFLLVVSATAYSQSEDNPELTLDGKSFRIHTWDLNKSDLRMPDDLIFENGLVDAPVCHEYGFYASPYKVFEAEGEIRFTFTNKSDYEGEIVFNGIVKGDKIEGMYTWTKPGDKELIYMFEGTLAE